MSRSKRKARTSIATDVRQRSVSPNHREFSTNDSESRLTDRSKQYSDIRSCIPPFPTTKRSDLHHYVCQSISRARSPLPFWKTFVFWPSSIRTSSYANHRIGSRIRSSASNLAGRRGGRAFSTAGIKRRSCSFGRTFQREMFRGLLASPRRRVKPLIMAGP